MKTYTLRMPDGRNYVVDDAICDQLNREQGRERVPGTVLDGLILMKCGCIAMEAGMRECEKMAKKRKAWSRLRPGQKMVENTVDALLETLEARQFISAQNNFNAVTLTVSSLPVQQYTNIRQDYLSEVTKAATANCAATCVLTRDEAKHCKLRRALDQIPGMKEAKREQVFSLGGCPYMTVEG